MASTDTPNGNTLSGATSTLELRRKLDAPRVQAPVAGRKTVTVEVKRRRPMGLPATPSASAPIAAPLSQPLAQPLAQSAASLVLKKTVAVAPSGDAGNLSAAEREARMSAIRQANQQPAAAPTNDTLRVVRKMHTPEPVAPTPPAPVQEEALAKAAVKTMPSIAAPSQEVRKSTTIQVTKRVEVVRSAGDLRRSMNDPKPAEQAAPESAQQQPSTPTRTNAPVTAEPLRRIVRRYEEQPTPRAQPAAQPSSDGAKTLKAKPSSNDDKKADPKKADAAAKKTDANRRQRKITVSAALSNDDGDRQRSLAAVKRRREKERLRGRGDIDERTKIVRDVVLPETITVQDLANRMSERTADVVKQLMKMGVMVTATQTLDADTAELVAMELGHSVKRVADADIEDVLGQEEDMEANLRHRAPVVTVMGHVDHGKTSLLDALRSTSVVSGEAGGITQHIGAYKVKLANGKEIAFIDTPGHEAFSEMRARGANVTDIVVLVVAADDGIKPQTVEALNHAKAAGVPIVVAINKVDKPDANPSRVRNELLKYELVAEELGGDVQCVEVSALKRLHLDTLVESILLQAEMLNLKANPNKKARGRVVEAQLDIGRGAVSTVLVQQGTLRVGDIFVAGSEWGKVRALVDSDGQRLAEAPPSTPVEVLGASGVPLAGDDFAVVDNEVKAREITQYRTRKQREKLNLVGRGSVEQMLSQIAEGVAKELTVVVKTDVHGSLEAIKSALEKIVHLEVKVRVLHSGVGSITESDIALANASRALVIGFNVRANAQARDLSKRDGVEIRYYSIIYNLLDDMKALASGLLSAETREDFIGYAEIRKVYDISKFGRIAGCMVTQGVIKRGCKVRLLRDNVVIHEGNLKTLKRFKDEVKEVKENFECGMAFENYQDIREKDMLECFEVVQVARSL